MDSVPIAVAAYSFVGFFTLVTPFLLHLITKKYVSAIEYDRINDVYSVKTFNIIGIPKQVSGIAFFNFFYLEIRSVVAF